MSFQLKGWEVHRSRASWAQVAEQCDIPSIYDQWSELVETPDTDAIVVGTWPNLHCRVTLAALAADKHVMCEARMAMDAREAQTVLDAARVKAHLNT